MAKSIDEQLAELAEQREGLKRELQKIRIREGELVLNRDVRRHPEHVDLANRVKASKLRLRKLKQQMDLRTIHLLPSAKGKVRLLRQEVRHLRQEIADEDRAYAGLVEAMHHLEREALTKGGYATWHAGLPSEVGPRRAQT